MKSISKELDFDSRSNKEENDGRFWEYMLMARYYVLFELRDKYVFSTLTLSKNWN